MVKLWYRGCIIGLFGLSPLPHKPNNPIIHKPSTKVITMKKILGLLMVMGLRVRLGLERAGQDIGCGRVYACMHVCVFMYVYACVRSCMCMHVRQGGGAGNI